MKVQTLMEVEGRYFLGAARFRPAMTDNRLVHCFCWKSIAKLAISKSALLFLVLLFDTFPVMIAMLIIACLLLALIKIAMLKEECL
jgi:hypothetical protein